MPAFKNYREVKEIKKYTRIEYVRHYRKKHNGSMSQISCYNEIGTQQRVMEAGMLYMICLTFNRMEGHISEKVSSTFQMELMKTFVTIGETSTHLSQRNCYSTSTQSCTFEARNDTTQQTEKNTSQETSSEPYELGEGPSGVQESDLGAASVDYYDAISVLQQVAALHDEQMQGQDKPDEEDPLSEMPLSSRKKGKKK
jgi:hypothetical protein